GIGSSTLTAAQVTDGSVRIAHAGDSSAFLIRENAMILKTAPQNREGFLTNTIGEYFEGATLYSKEIKSGDYLILATDGVTAVLTKADIEGFHSGSPEFFFVAEADKKILGLLCGRESNPPAETLDKWKSRKVASIETLAVDENYRRRGIATSLLTAIFEAFKQKEIDLVTLSVPAVEVAAIKLYGKIGFEPRGYFLWKRLDS